MRYPEDHLLPVVQQRDTLYPLAQERFIQEHQELLLRMREQYAPYFNQLGDAYQEAAEHHGDPHAKRALRIMGWREGHFRGHVGSGIWVRSVWYKMKKNEIAKPGKYPRGIGDLGVLASLRGFRITEIMKEAQAGQPIIHHRGVIRTVKTSNPFVLTELFRQVEDPDMDVLHGVFSDDGVYCIRTPAGVQRFNVDISSCDSSHSTALFQAYVQLFPERLQGDVQALVDQCTRSIRVISVHDRSRKVLLKPNGPVLYSGSTLTTSLNNFANALLGIAFAEDRPATVEAIQASALRVGYKVSVEPCANIQGVQFLKHSPMYDTQGMLRPVLNIGVLLRLSGVVDGDLPGRGPLQPRAHNFQQSLLRSAYPRCSHSLVDGMKREGFSPVDVSAYTFKYTDDTEDYPPFYIPDSEFCLRYGLNHSQWLELCTQMGAAGYGDSCQSPVGDRVLKTDYELEWP
jgi:hypothetical protein